MIARQSGTDATGGTMLRAEHHSAWILLSGWARITRRELQIALGLLWLLDGALQLQPFMLGTGFADRIISPAGDGQPGFVSGSVDWGASVIAAHPVAWDVPFAVIQLLLGLGLLVPRTTRLASPSRPRSRGHSASGSSARVSRVSSAGTPAC